MLEPLRIFVRRAIRHGGGTPASSGSHAPAPDMIRLRPAIDRLSAGAARSMPFAIVLLFAAGAAVYRHSVSPDGLIYLDMAEAIGRGQWWLAGQGAWSPLLPALLAAWLDVTGAGRAVEAVSAHAFQVVAAGVAVGAFYLLVRELELSVSGSRERPDAAQRMFAWGVAAWAVLWMIGPALVTPDVMLAAAYFGASALTLRAIRGGSRPAPWLALGATLAVGYLTKTIFFYLAPLYVASAALDPRAVQRWRAIGLTALSFGVVAAPNIVLQSWQAGHATVGGVSRIAHAYDVRGVRLYHYQGDAARAEVLAHPTRVVSRTPTIYEFAEPFPVTYPPAYGIAHWYEGVQVDLSSGALVATVDRAARALLRYAGVVLLILMLLILATRHRERALLRVLPLVLPATGAIALYLLAHVEARYVGAPVALLGAALALGTPRGGALRTGLLVAGTAVILQAPLWAAAGNLAALAGWFEPSFEPTPHRMMAATMREAGLQPGDRIAVVGPEPGAYWARLAGIRIVAEVDEADGPSLSTDGRLPCARAVLAATGARALVARAERVPQDSAWRQVTDGWVMAPITGGQIEEAAAACRITAAPVPAGPEPPAVKPPAVKPPAAEPPAAEPPAVKPPIAAG